MATTPSPEAAATSHPSGLRPGAQRWLVYIAGRSTPSYLGMLNELMTLAEAPAEALVVIGDLFNFRRAQAARLDPRIQIAYQHESFDPFRGKGPLPGGRLAVLEERYGAPNLWRYVLAQPTIRDRSERDQLAYLHAYLEYFEGLAERYRPDVFLTGNPDSLPFLVAYEVLKRHGALVLAMAPARIPGRFFVLDNDMEQVPGLADCYRALQQRLLTPEEEALAARVRSLYVVDRIRPPYVGRGSLVRPLPSPLLMVRRQWQRLRYADWYFDAWLRDEARTAIAIRARWPFQWWDLRRLTRAPVAGEPYFYYPLHYEPEFSIDILGSNASDQVQVIERVSSALPAGFRLYVKEHPNMFPGSRRLGFYRRLLRLGNVTLIKGTQDGRDLIADACGVVTIAGTSGFEALFYGKPVLLFGRAFYEAFTDGVTRVGDYESIARTLQEIANGDRGFSQASFARFIVAVYRRSYEGWFEGTTTGIDTPENLAALARGVSAELRVRGATRPPVDGVSST